MGRGKITIWNIAHKYRLGDWFGRHGGHCCSEEEQSKAKQYIVGDSANAMYGIVDSNRVESQGKQASRQAKDSGMKADDDHLSPSIGSWNRGN